MTLLTIVGNVSDELGIAKPTTVYGNTDPQVRQLLAIANRVGDIMHKEGDNAGWSILQRLHEFTTANGTAEYALPSDFGWLIDDTAWDSTNYWEMRGPLTPQQWAVQKYAIIANANFRKRWRIKRTASGNTKTFFIDPTPTSTDDLVLEYVSNGWVVDVSDSNNVTTAFTADNDTILFDEKLFEMGMIWRWGARKGFDVSIDLPDFENELEKAIARDSGGQRLSLNGRNYGGFYTNIQEGNFDSS